MGRTAGRGIDLRSGEPAYRALGLAVHGVNTVVANRRWSGQENVPATGGALVVSNHMTNYDPLTVGEFLIWSGRWPRYLGKSELWRTPVVGWFARACRQIPVERNSARAVDSLAAAREAIEHGELVAIYPEGTRGLDPEGWPTTGRTGAARLALETRCPVIPVGQWGAHEVIGWPREGVPRIFPRRTIEVVAGEPLDLSDLYDAADQRLAVRVAHERILRAITGLVAGLRGEPEPVDRWDMRRKQRVPLGPMTLDAPPPAEVPPPAGA